MERIRLKKAGIRDVKKLHSMKQEAFRNLYELYKDSDTNPACEPIEKIELQLLQEEAEYFMVFCDENPIGGVRVRLAENIVGLIGPLFLIPDYQNKGIGQRILKEIFAAYDQINIWQLDTIKEERALCGFYEKMGFHQTGIEQRVKEGMTLVSYERKKGA